MEKCISLLNTSQQLDSLYQQNKSTVLIQLFLALLLIYIFGLRMSTFLCLLKYLDFINNGDTLFILKKVLTY